MSALHVFGDKVVRLALVVSMCNLFVDCLMKETIVCVGLARWGWSWPAENAKQLLEASSKES